MFFYWEIAKKFGELTKLTYHKMRRVYTELEFKWQVIITINLLAASTFIIQGFLYAFITVALGIIFFIEAILLFLVFFTPYYDFYIDRKMKFLSLNQDFNTNSNTNSQQETGLVFAAVGAFVATLSYFVSLFAELLSPIFKNLELAFPVLNFDINIFNIVDFDFFSLLKSLLSIFQFILYFWIIMKIRRKIREKVRKKINGSDYDYFERRFFENISPY